MSSPIRRSKRNRTETKKYTNDGWDAATLDILQGSSPEPQLEVQGSERPSSDDEFENPETAQRSGDEISQGNNATASPNAVIRAGAGNNARNNATRLRTRSSTATSKSRGKAVKSSLSEHSRGVQNLERRLGKTSIFRASYGPLASDMKEILQARDRWHLSGRDGAFPSRKSLASALQNEWSIKALGPSLDRIDLDHSAISAENQKLQRRSHSDMLGRRFVTSSFTQDLVLGPPQEQRLFSLPHLESLNFGEVWTESSRAKAQGADKVIEGDANDHGHDLGHGVKKCYQGWLINTGEKIQALSWTSHASQTVQFLAVACRSASSQRQKSSGGRDGSTPAFTPSAGYMSNVQIWKLNMQRIDTSDLLLPDYSKPPKLVQMLGCSFGDIREMEWLPSVPDRLEISGEKQLGRLGLLSTDGCMRVLCIPPPDGDSVMDCYEVMTPKICIEPGLDFIFTTFCFCGSADLLLGASDGTVRAYNLAVPAIPPENIEPYLKLQLHLTYVLQITTAGSGRLSHFIVTTSAAGDLRLTDLRAPDQDSIYLSRARLPTRNLIYHPATQSFITSIDRSGRTDIVNAQTAIVAHQLRHFYTQMYLCKFPNNTGTATALAGSQLHPYILIGNSQGTVMCQNVMRRMLPRAGGFITTVCEYDWIPTNSTISTFIGVPIQAQDEASSDTQSQQAQDIDPYLRRHQSEEHEPRNSIARSKETISSNITKLDHNFSLYFGHDVRPGRSRFREGFIPRTIDLRPETVVNSSGGGNIVQKIKGKSKAGPKSNSEAKTKTKTQGKAKANGKGKGQGKRKGRGETVDDQETLIVGNGTEINFTEVQGQESARDVGMYDVDVDVDDGLDNNNIQDDEIEMANDEEDDGKEQADEGTTEKGNPVAEVVFEEEQAVTCIQWNEDPRCAALVAMGWGSGILRIEDLSVNIE